MKSTFLFLSFALVLFASCKDQPKQETPTSETIDKEQAHSNGLEGTWELTGFYNYKDDEVVDSFEVDPEFRQLKMFTNTKVMWCKHRAADSSEWFGYGTYNFDGDHLTEVLDFGSSIMDKVIEEKKQFKFELDLYPNRFKQIEIDENGNRIYSENYVRVE